MKPISELKADNSYLFLFKLLGIICVAYAGFRIILNIGDSLWLDESTSYFTIKDGLTVLFQRVSEYQSQSPLYYLLIYLSTHLFGFTETALRIPSAISIFLAARVVYEITNKIKDKYLACVALAIFLNLSLVQEFAVTARPYALGLLFTCLAVQKTFALLDNFKTLDRLGLAIYTLLAIYTHYLMSPVVIYCYYYLLCQRRKHFKIILLDCVIIIICCFPLLEQIYYIVKRKESISYLPLPLLEDIIYKIIPENIALCTLYSVIFISILERFVPKWKNNLFQNEHLIFIFSWTTLPVIFLAILANLTNGTVFQDRYFVPATGGLAILISMLLYTCCQKEKIFFKAAIFFLCFLLLSNNILRKNENWKDAISVLNGRNVSKSIVLLWPGLIESNQLSWIEDAHKSQYLKSPITFYQIDSEVRILPWYYSSGQNREYVEMLITKLLENNNSIYLLARYDNGQHESLYKYFQENNLTKEHIGEYGGVTLIEFKK